MTLSNWKSNITSKGFAQLDTLEKLQEIDVSGCRQISESEVNGYLLERELIELSTLIIHHHGIR